MKSSRARNDHRVLARAHRLDPRRESRCSLVLIMLMGLATVSVMAATTQVVSSANAGTPALSSQR
ncbi:MAG TPA: hypothetical protein VK434_07175 [Microvirga sp.]|jgi:hypothetical protein|nr:hypothetical protein [Microvirga sp.]